MTLNRIIAEYGLEKLNSATKYPSILTYHAMGEKGVLSSELSGGERFGSSAILMTEKIDGTNARIIFDESGDFIIGSREDLIYACGDRIWNLKQPILKELLAHDIQSIINGFANKGVTVLYGEVYSEKVNTGYATSHGFLLFDAVSLNLDILDSSLNEISLWRENGGQSFYSVETLDSFRALASQVPCLTGAGEPHEAPPEDLKGTYDYLCKHLPHSNLEGVKKPEGVIIRTLDRKLIRKLRFQDYERTIRHQMKKN